MIQHTQFLLAAAFGLLLSACQAAPPTGPYAPPAAAGRDPGNAQALTRRAAELIQSDPAAAERLLREALTHDVFHGPAHNNLGVILLRQGQLYEAANEFEWARTLMPGHPDPRINLALVFEAVGRDDQALASYVAALEVYPGHLPAMQGLARLQVRTDRTDVQTIGLLEDIALRAEHASWREWATHQRLRLQAREPTSPLR